MSSRRVLKAAEAIREVVSMAILTEIRDPRVKDVTVTFVELSADMRNAKVHVSVMGDEKKQNLCLRGLQNSVGFLQSKVGKRIETRYVPKIQFELDRGIKNAMIVTRILEEVLPKNKPTEPADSQDQELDDFDEYDTLDFDCSDESEQR
jgi:ribosome-binding factor A